MWALENDTEFAAERGWTRDREGAEVWLVCVKATFALLDDGATELLPVQPPVHLAPVFHGDPAATSLEHDADLVWAKPGTDVLVQGSAHSLGGPVTELPLGFKIGPVARHAVAIGERVWERTVGGVAPGAAHPFVKSALRWEAAFGGTDASAEPPAWEPRNPVGRGFSRHGVQPPGAKLPTLEHSTERVRNAASRPTPVGFGPIARHWEPRVTWAGTYDDAWMQRRRPLLPHDFDVRYQHAAPAEQRVAGHLRGGEGVALLNLHPRVARYRTTLPQIDLLFRTVFRDRPAAAHRGKMTAVAIDTDQATLAMVWMAELPCHHLVQRLLRTEIGIMPRVRVPAGRVASAT